MKYQIKILLVFVIGFLNIYAVSAKTSTIIIEYTGNCDAFIQRIVLSIDQSYKSNDITNIPMIIDLQTFSTLCDLLGKRERKPDKNYRGITGNTLFRRTTGSYYLITKISDHNKVQYYSLMNRAELKALIASLKKQLLLKKIDSANYNEIKLRVERLLNKTQGLNRE